MAAAPHAPIPIRPSAADDPGDAELVVRARDGGTWARGELFLRHAPRLTAMLTRLLASTTDAEDAVQDTFVEAFETLSSLREPGAFGGWVTRIAVHKAHRRFRKRKLLRMLGLDRAAPDATLAQLADLDAPPEVRAELVLVERVLATLPVPERMAWMLRHVEGHELLDVARACDCSLATVKRRIAAAEEKIGAHLRAGEGRDA